MHHAPAGPARRALFYAALFALLGVASLALTQCTQVTDRLTGVELSHGKRASCVGQCQRVLEHLLSQERRLHHQNLKSCKRDEACETAEEARHRAAVESLFKAYRECRAQCHRQGGGDGDD